MRGYLIFLICCLISTITGCSKRETNRSQTNPQLADTAEAGQASTKVSETCSLLTSNEIEGILGAPLKEIKPSTNSRDGLTVSQCYFLLPVAADSIVLTVTQKAEGSNSRDPKQSWGMIFHGDKEKENDREEEESKAPPPENILGLGDEAFWLPQRFGGALYALKGNTYIRISVGGQDDQATRIKKSKSLAEIVLKRL
jgi:hypothetical protein